MLSRRSYVALLLLWVAAATTESQSAMAASPADTTVITVKSLCPTCGKKIVQKLSKLPQVQNVTMDVAQGTLTVLCVPGGSVSPRDMWETVERGGEQPIKLEGPAGTFTTKPPQ
jgi:hypothetical protein